MLRAFRSRERDGFNITHIAENTQPKDIMEDRVLGTCYRVAIVETNEEKKRSLEKATTVKAKKCKLDLASSVALVDDTVINRVLRVDC